MLQIKTNAEVKNQLFYPELSYVIVGILYSTHNELGPWAKEKQYCDVIERKLRESKISYIRECSLGASGNRTDFIVDGKIILEIKAKRIIIQDDYIQAQRYLQESKLKLAILVNFRTKYVKPLRIVKIDMEKN